MQENYTKTGIKALDNTMDFCEEEVIKQNIEYLKNTLEVSFEVQSFK